HHNGDHGVAFSGKVRTEGHVHKNVYISHVKAFHNYGEIGKTQSHTGNGIVVGNTDSVLIEFCEAYENGKDNSFHGGGPVGIWLWDCNQSIIQFSESHHNHTNSKTDGGGFDLDGGCTNCSLQYNYSHNNDGAGYLIAEYSGARPLINNEIHHNISVNDGLKNNYGGVFLWRGQGILSGLKVYDNFVYSAGKSTGFKIVSDSIRNISVENNFFISDGKADLVGISDTTQNLNFADNLFHSLSGKYNYADLGKSYSTIEKWIEKGQIISSPGKEFQAEELKTWTNQILDEEFGRSLLTLMVKHQEGPLSWEKLLPSPLPQFAGYPKKWDVFSSPKGGVNLFWELPLGHQVKEIRVERKRDFEEDFSEFARIVRPEKAFVFLDENPYAGESSYRIQLWENETKYSYSPTRNISPTGLNNPPFYVFPARNPDRLVIFSEESVLNSYSVKVYDSNGEVVWEQFFEGGGKFPVSLFLENELSLGIYFVVVESRGGSFLRKFFWKGDN
ncbi:MAG: T9SS type A sorting domain-containing protein, partial [Bacteroidetes bacterium]|nr:T9SS type A sorting domain-containing protein [Bacteroidota bacterium]